ncbi:MAG: tetratricopeptide repeat protein, partial [Candidatus Zixiibacteriota bacterium]
MRSSAILLALLFAVAPSLLCVLSPSLSAASAAHCCIAEEDISGIRPEALRDYRKGEDCLKKGKEPEAFKHLKRALELDPNIAQAHNKLGEIYMNRDTPGNRALAKEQFQKALLIDRDNPLYNFNLGLLYKEQGFNNLAEKQFKDVVEIDPNHAEAYYNLGLIYEKELLESKNKVIYEEIEPPTTLPIARDKVVLPFPTRDEDFKKTVEHYQKVLEIDPNFRDALFRLGLVYVDFRREDIAADLFSRVLDKNPEDKEAHLFLGLAYHRLRKEEESFNHFNDALSLMDSEERSLYSSIGFVSTQDEEKIFASLEPTDKDNFIEGFWVTRDPLYLTDENERVLEHYSRVAYANLRFGVPKMRLQGYDTDRGKVYISYGEPDFIMRVPWKPGGRADEKIAPDMSGISRPPFNVYKDPVFNTKLFFAKAELWSYNINGENFRFAFEDSYMSGEFRFSATRGGRIRSRFPGDYEYQYVSVKRSVPESYEFDYGGELFAFPCDFADFRGDNGSSKLEVYYGLPIQELSDTATVQTGVFVFDDRWQKV